MNYQKFLKEALDNGVIRREAFDNISSTINNIDSEIVETGEKVKSAGFFDNLFHNSQAMKMMTPFQKALSSAKASIGDLSAEEIASVRQSVLEGVSKNKNPNIMSGIKTLGALAILPFAVEEVASVIKRKMEPAPSLQTVLDKNPDISEKFESQKVKDFYDTMAKFSPEIARNPVAAGSVLRGMLNISQESVDPQQIKSLVDIQRDIADTKKPSPVRTISDIMKTFNFLGD